MKLTETCEVEIQSKVTPKILKGLKELGLMKTEVGADEINIVTDIFTDDEKFKKLVNLVCVIKEEPNYDEIDLGEFLEGYKSFFFGLVKK
jgi:hypothetical protein